MPGNQQLPLPLTPAADALCAMACECNKIVPKPEQRCTELGTEKHDCCEQKIQEHNATNKQPRLGGERGYKQDGTEIHEPRFPPPKPGSVWPDACSVDAAGNPTQFFDFKFGCPPGQPVRQKLIKKPPLVHPGWSRGQKTKVMKVGRKLEPPVVKEPKIISPASCNC